MPASPACAMPIRLPASGTEKATALLPDGPLGVVASRSFAGLVPQG